MHIQGNSWPCTGGKGIQIINHIVAIPCANTVTNGIWIWTNCSGTCERSTTFAISVMQTVQTNFMRNYLHLHKANFFDESIDEFLFSNSFSDHNELRDHFIENHFLCQDGECKENIFSAVFRTDIDLKGENPSTIGLICCEFLKHRLNFIYLLSLLF